MLNAFTDSIALKTFLLLAQGEAQPELTPAQSIISNPFLPIAGLFFIYYFIVLQPERKKKREDAIMKSQIKKNDRIITVGGIHGTIMTAATDSNVVTLKLDESGTTKIKINRSAIATVIKEKTSKPEG